MPHVIEIRENSEISFLAYDEHSGGYPWFPTSRFSAHFFKTKEDAVKEVNLWLKEANMHMADGKQYVPTIFRQIGKFSNIKKRAALIVRVVELGGAGWLDVSAVTVAAWKIGVADPDADHRTPYVSIEEMPV